MAVWFDKASSQGVDNLASPFTTAPFAMGCWFCPVVGGAPAHQNIMSISAAPAPTYIAAYLEAGTNVMTVEKTGGVVAQLAAITLNAWHYLLLQVASATNIRMTMLDAKGAVTNVQNTSVGTITGFNTISLGSLVMDVSSIFLSGGIGEFWYTNANIIPNAAVPDNNLVRRIAYDGPLSVPAIVKSLMEYRRFISNPLSANGEELYHGGRKQQIWTNKNGSMCGPHPPLPPSYAKIKPTRSLLLV